MLNIYIGIPKCLKSFGAMILMHTNMKCTLYIHTLADFSKPSACISLCAAELHLQEVFRCLVRIKPSEPLWGTAGAAGMSPHQTQRSPALPKPCLVSVLAPSQLSPSSLSPDTKGWKVPLHSVLHNPRLSHTSKGQTEISALCNSPALHPLNLNLRGLNPERNTPLLHKLCSKGNSTAASTHSPHVFMHHSYTPKQNPKPR